MKAFDVIVIGAGPGGISAALWAHRLDLDVLLLDGKTRVGGQLLDLHNPIVDYLGIPAENGPDLQGAFKAHLNQHSVPTRLGARVASIDVEPLQVHVDGKALRCRRLIVATGARRKALGVPGEVRLTGRGVSDSASRDRGMYKGREVAIIGGGDAALENALNLVGLCPKITIISRSQTLRARKVFQERVEAEASITVLRGQQVRAIQGDDWVTAIALSGPKGDWTLPVHTVCIRVGTEPASDLLRGIAHLDDQGFVRVDAAGRTDVDGIFAIGDVANRLYPSVAASVGQGMIAAKAISMEREAVTKA